MLNKGRENLNKMKIKKSLILFIVCLSTLMVYQSLAQIHESPEESTDSNAVAVPAHQPATGGQDENQEEDFGGILLFLLNAGLKIVRFLIKFSNYILNQDLKISLISVQPTVKAT